MCVAKVFIIDQTRSSCCGCRCYEIMIDVCAAETFVLRRNFLARHTRNECCMHDGSLFFDRFTILRKGVARLNIDLNRRAILRHIFANFNSFNSDGR